MPLYCGFFINVYINVYHWLHFILSFPSPLTFTFCSYARWTSSWTFVTWWGWTINWHTWLRVICWCSSFTSWRWTMLAGIPFSIFWVPTTELAGIFLSYLFPPWGNILLRGGRFRGNRPPSHLRGGPVSTRYCTPYVPLTRWSNITAILSVEISWIFVIFFFLTLTTLLRRRNYCTSWSYTHYRLAFASLFENRFSVNHF